MDIQFDVDLKEWSLKIKRFMITGGIAILLVCQGQSKSATMYNPEVSFEHKLSEAWLTSTRHGKEPSRSRE